MIELKTYGLATRPLEWKESEVGIGWVSGPYRISKNASVHTVYFNMGFIGAYRGFKQSIKRANDHHRDYVTNALIKIEKEVNRG